MSGRTYYLVDLLQELDKRYNAIRLVSPGDTVSLDDLGDGGFEIMAQTIDTVQEPALVMHTQLPCIQRVELHLQENDAGLWDVRVETGAQGEELRINDILGRLKEIYG